MESSHGSTRQDRKTIEKNRRIYMKELYHKLDSLLPSSPSSREGAALPLPDRLDKAVNYIKGLQQRLERMKERKRQLMGQEAGGSSEQQGSSGSRLLPQIEVQELGSGLRAVLMVSAADPLVFYEAVRVLVEDGAEIRNANFSVTGDRAFHTIHSSSVGDPRSGLEAAGTVLERLKKAVHDLAM